ncbi:unnamed protein product [Boreogadus saida]
MAPGPVEEAAAQPLDLRDCDVQLQSEPITPYPPTLPGSQQPDPGSMGAPLGTVVSLGTHHLVPQAELHARGPSAVLDVIQWTYQLETERRVCFEDIPDPPRPEAFLGVWLWLCLFLRVSLCDDRHVLSSQRFKTPWKTVLLVGVLGGGAGGGITSPRFQIPPPSEESRPSPPCWDPRGPVGVKARRGSIT